MKVFMGSRKLNLKNYKTILSPFNLQNEIMTRANQQ